MECDASLVDVIVTRRENDPTAYRGIISMFPEVNLIEVEYVPGSVIQARMNLINYGSSPYICWFDPDDILHPWGVRHLLNALKSNMGIDGIMTLSDTGISGGKPRRIRFEEFHKYPVNCHLLRVIRRDWLNEHIEYFNNPVPEWALLAKLLLANSFVLPVIGYTWVPGDGATHQKINQQEITATKRKVQELLGDKYDYKSKIRAPHIGRKQSWQT